MILDSILQLESIVLSMDNDWYLNNIWTPEGDYQWKQGYIMDKYLDMHEMTKNPYWISKFITHADSVLAQRDDTYVWSELSSGYSWNGFAAAMVFSMARFSFKYPAHPKATEYATAAYNAIATFDDDWVVSGDTGYWIYNSDHPSLTLRNKSSAYNMQSLMGIACIYLANCATLDSQTRSTCLQKATMYAGYFKTKLVDNIKYYLWNYAPYNTRLDDIGHANLNAFFIYLAFRNGIVFTVNDVLKASETFRRIIKNDGSVPNNLVDGDTSIVGTAKVIFYWQYLCQFSSGLFRRVKHYENLTPIESFIELISTRHAFWLNNINI